MALNIEVPSCGILFETNLDNDPELIVRQWCSSTNLEFLPILLSMILFTDNTYTSWGRKYSTGQMLRNYIRKHALGRVTATRPVRNPNSGNDIQLFTYFVNNEALRVWYNDPARSWYK